MYMVWFLLSYAMVIAQLMIPFYITELTLSGLLSLGTLSVVTLYSLTCQVSRLKLKPYKTQLVGALGLLFILMGSMCIPYMLVFVDNVYVSALCFSVAVMEWTIFSNRVYKAVNINTRG